MVGRSHNATQGTPGGRTIGIRDYAMVQLGDIKGIVGGAGGGCVDSNKGDHGVQGAI